MQRGFSEPGIAGEEAAAEHRAPAITESLEAIAQDIARDGYAFRAGEAMRSIFGSRVLDAWRTFASSWDDLGLDLYMADGGRYRRRRFGVLHASSGGIDRKDHQPHYQSRDHNPVNGGIERWFMPVDDSVIDNAFGQGLLRYCTALFDTTSATKASVSPWHVEMHQFRIEATATETGSPTPEGPHRDGVDWVCVMLINRTNVSSGVTQIFDPAGEPLGEFTLTDPLDTVFLDDRRVFHGVTPIAPIDPADKAFRDVLVLTYRREHGAPPG